MARTRDTLKKVEEAIEKIDGREKMRPAFTAFSGRVLTIVEANETRREKAKGELERGSRAGKGRFRL